MRSADDSSAQDDTQDASAPDFGDATLSRSGRRPAPESSDNIQPGLSLSSSIKSALARIRDEESQPIGPYKLLEKIGEGGFGVVYLAEQSEPVRRRVALKIIKPGMDSRQVVTRFEQERQALAVMDHPNIARVLDAGTTNRGLPYFVMEHIKGESITAYCDRQNLTIRDRLKVFIPVCEAVQHAHMKGIIHRDIKPSNVLVAAGDHGPVVKVIDFGVAKALAHNMTQATIFTEQGQLIGTPEYMSPEQAEMGATDIDTRTDVYSLGVLLYELLAGATPFDPVTLRAAGMVAIQRMIREIDPPKPSTRFSSLGAAAAEVVRHRQTGHGELSRELSRELDWIPLKAMRKDRTDRYPSPSELADDVRNYLEGRPLKAGPESSAYLLRKYVRRHRAPLAAAATIAMLLIGGIAGTTTFALRSSAAARREADQRKIAESNERRAADEALRATRESERAEAERDRAEQVTLFVTKVLLSSDPHQGGTQGLLVTEAMNQAVRLLESGELKDQPATEASLRLTIADILNGNGRPSEALGLAEQGLAIYKRVHSADDPDVAMALNNVASCLSTLSRFSDALTHVEAALEMHQRLYEGDHSSIATGLNNVASCLRSLGKSSEALPKYEAALEMRQRLFKGDHPDVAASLNNVAFCLDSLSRSTEALPKHESALEMRRRLFKGDHPDVAGSMNNVASCLLALGKPDEALPKYESALEMLRRFFNGDHPSVATAIDNVAYCLNEMRKSGEALPKFEEAQAMRERIFKGDHHAIVISLNNVAGCLNALGRLETALPKYEAALAMSRRLSPGNHPDIALALNNLADCHDSLGRKEEALKNYEASLEMEQRLAEGRDHTNVALSLNNVAYSLRTQGREAEALQKYEAALAMFRRTLPAGHPRILYSQIGMAKTLILLKRFADAEPLLLDAAKQCGKSDICRQTHWAGLLPEMVKLYDSWHAAEPGMGYDTKAAEWRSKAEVPPNSGSP